MKWDVGEDFCATKGFLLITKEPEPSLLHWLSQLWGSEGGEKRMKLKGTSPNTHTDTHTVESYPLLHTLYRKIRILKLIVELQCLYIKRHRILKPEL